MKEEKLAKEAGDREAALKSEVSELKTKIERIKGEKDLLKSQFDDANKKFKDANSDITIGKLSKDLHDMD